MDEPIRIRGARVHNLKNIDLDVPRGKLVVFSGVSGAGKSSLVFDTLFVEAQRQLVETFSTFAQRRLPKLSRPDVDSLSNLGTAIVIDQKRLGRTLRSTVGTATEINTYLRLLWSRCAKPFVGPSHLFSFNHPEGMCPDCAGLGRRIRIDEAKLIDPAKSLREGGVVHPDFKVGGYYWRDFTSNGLFDIDKPLGEWNRDELHLLLRAKDAEVERVQHGVAYRKKWEGLLVRLERLYVNKGEDELPEARKDAYQRYLVHADCDTCGGGRLNPRARGPRLGRLDIVEACDLELTDLDAFLEQVDDPVAESLVRKIRSMLGHLVGIGAGYLSLSRSVATLSGGESQRVKMARQLDCDLTGLMYVLDEPSVGLHPRDTEKLLELLRHLRDQGNSVLVVEHDPDILRAADHVVEIGPRAGRDGGRVMFQGSVERLMESDCASGRMLREARLRKDRLRRTARGVFEIRDARAHNLRGVDVDIPRGVLCAIAGVAGSGKSSLVHEELAKRHPSVVVDQLGVARSSRSNLLTWTGLFDAVRKGFAAATGAGQGLFSFNSGGACPECKGQGTLRLEMNFMDDVAVACPSCEGDRYLPEVLSLRWNGLNIAQVLDLTVAEALEFFHDKAILKQLRLLDEVGLGYVQLGQSLSTLSGGEGQRLKLASELNREGNLYILDEPTTGLHLSDIEQLLAILHRLVDAGNSVVVIEHNVELLRQADHIVELGPGAGKDGGLVVAQGAPEELRADPSSLIGRFL
ncbi:MAG TPA: excinuclease ABC subunit UvrA [Fibrobacteria bacterium]|nr:excinuclease ABC subunit UvrA [Fibrobacteria bacterium]HOX52969.1 excinuclease ABC subunit UvrA [Fibrobacteria bacterium]